MRREVDGLGGWFPAQQDELYLRVYTRRVEYGYPVNHFWLQTEFRSILEETKPDGFFFLNPRSVSEGVDLEDLGVGCQNNVSKRSMMV